MSGIRSRLTDFRRRAVGVPASAPPPSTMSSPSSNPVTAVSTASRCPITSRARHFGIHCSVWSGYPIVRPCLTASRPRHGGPAGHEAHRAGKGLCAVRLSLESVGEDDRDGEAAVCGPPSFAEPVYDGSRFGGGVEPNAFAVGANADEAVQGAKFAPEGPLRSVDVAHAVTMVAPNRFSTA